MLVVSGVAMIAAVTLTTATLVVKFHDHALNDSERELSNTALILSEQLDRTFQALDLVQTSLIDRMRSFGIASSEDYERRMSGHDVHSMLKDKISGLPHVDALTLIDADGKLINFSRRWPIPAGNAADRDYFKALTSSPDLSFFVSEPVQNRGTGKWTILFARKFTGPDGRFVGIVLGAMELQYFEKVFGSIALGPRSSISLLREGGMLLARHPRLEGSIGKTFTGGTGALEGRSSVTTRMVSSIDNSERLVALRRLPNFPLVVAAGDEVAAILGHWRQETIYLLAAGGIVVFAVCLIVFLIARELRRGINLSNQSLQDQKRKLDAALNHMTQGLCMLDTAARLVLCNQRYLQMYGLSPDAVKVGITLRDLMELRKASGSFPGDPEQYCSDLLAAIAQGSMTRHLVEANDGRMIEIVNQPMAGGGWIATHNDVTQQRRAEADINAARAKAEAAEREARAAHARLLEAIEVVPEGLALFDAEDRYVLWNRRYAELYSDGGLQIRVGARFEDTLRAGLATGKYAIAEGREEEWVNERLARHREMRSTHDQRLPGNRWVRVEERRTADGGSIGVRIDITELKQREASFRLLFEHNPLPMYVFDGESLRFLAVNETALAHYGYSREQFRAMTLLDIRPAEDRERFKKAVPTFKHYQVAENWRHQKSDGTVFDVDVYSRKLNYQGRPARFAAVIDTTERRRAEKERDRNRDFLDLIIENVPSIIVVKDARDFRYILVNKVGEEDFGIPRHMIIGRTVHEVLPKASADHLTALDRKLLAMGDGPLISEHAIETAARDARIGVSKRLVIRDDEGNPQYLLAVIDDVSERRRLEEERNRTREFLHGIIENIPTTIFVRDVPERRYLLVNRAAEELWGMSRDDMIGRTPRDLFSTETADMVAGHDQALLQSDAQLIVEEHTVRTRNNGARQVRAKRLSIRNEKGEPQYLLGVMEDVTESRAIEQQLQQAQKMEAVGNLTGGLAHDFNNLLTIVIGNLDLLQMDVAGNRAAEQKVETILQAAERGADLTRHMLAFARRQPLNPRRLDINELISDTTRLLARTLGQNITINLQLGDDLWPVIADAGQLEAALVNIAINARDAMPDGGVLSLVSARSRLDAAYAVHQPETAAGDYVMIELRDTGNGMPADVLAQIFEPFFTTKAPGKGSGLGLSMVYGFIKQSGGHVTADSTIGEGTTFRLYLPRAVEAEVSSAGEATLHCPPPGAKQDVILAVDDNPALRVTVAAQLRQLGYRVFEADNAQAALEVLDSMERIDLLFTDIVMPGPVNGKELAAKARLMRPGLKVLFTSGFPGTLLADGTESEDRDLLLSKPYRKHDLTNAIHQVLGK